MAKEPKFKVGQIVVMKIKTELQFRVIDMQFVGDSWAYARNRKSYVSEISLRALTLQEKGE